MRKLYIICTITSILFLVGFIVRIIILSFDEDNEQVCIIPSVGITIPILLEIDKFPYYTK